MSLCNLCGGLGWVEAGASEFPDKPVARCSCLELSVGERARREFLSDVPVEMRNIDLDFSSEDFARLMGNRAVSFAHKIIQNFVLGGSTFLFLHGKSGIGKTILSVASALAALERSPSSMAKFISWPYHVESVRGEYRNKKRVDIHPAHEIAVLDDVFPAGAESEFSKMLFYRIVVHRHNRYMKTIINSVFSPRSTIFPEQIQRRLQMGTTICL